uniref:Uncharacterized protein n=1 Tax=Anguilla anguilla TaxID=7936 RepID=A0A0E9T9C8_ANGAN
MVIQNAVNRTEITEKSSKVNGKIFS